MLRVGLTGELGSGKSTVAKLLAAYGAVVLSSDEMGRALMQPGQPVFAAIVEHFGPSILSSDGTLNRQALSMLAFDPDHQRVEELNALVHPAVVAEQERQIAQLAQAQPNAIVIVESALLLTTKHAGGDEPWRRRFDRVVLVTAPEALKISRYMARASPGHPLDPAEYAALEADARRRLAAQRISADLAVQCIAMANDGGMEALSAKVDALWQSLLKLESEAHTPKLTTHS